MSLSPFVTRERGRKKEREREREKKKEEERDPAYSQCFKTNKNYHAR